MMYLYALINQPRIGLFSRVYNTGLSAYKALLRLLAPFNPKARQWLTGQQDLLSHIARSLASESAAGPAKPLAWFHAASLGEFEQGRPVIEAFRKAYPDYRILLTFFSPSGYEVRKNYDGADYVFYLPLDTSRQARAFVALTQPRIAFFIKYEFWANYLQTLRAAGVPTILFSAIFRPDQLFFKPYGGFYRKLLTCFDYILVQNQESVELLRGVGVQQVSQAGDTRFDRVAQVAAGKKAIPVAQAFSQGQPVLVVGSAWQADMDVLIPFLNQFDKPLKVIIAPHEINAEAIEQWRKQLQKRSVRFSQTNETDVVSADVLFIDNIGMLTSLYQYGEFAFIGGAFRQGLHNSLEAATFGMPIFFGPVYSKFQEAVDLVEAGGAFPVTSVAELTAAFDRQYADPTVAAAISRAYVQRNVGATAQVMQVVHTLLPH